jgi:arsenate reductase
MTITIYHNPGCSKSRKTLELIESRGISPRIVEYLKETPDAATLLKLAELLRQPLTAVLRTSEAEFAEAGGALFLDDDAKLAGWLQEHPRVLQRPIVVNEETRCAIIGRPPENVYDILDND